MKLLQAGAEGEESKDKWGKRYKMIKVSALTIFILINFICTDAIGADWKFYGGTTIKSEEAICFYDDESIEYLPNGNIKAWTKSIISSEFDKYIKNNEIIAKSTRKMLINYMPPYIIVKSETSFNDYLNIIMWEEVANHTIVKPYLKVLFELNCTDKKIRYLSAIYYAKDKVGKSSPNNGEWDYIVPETNSETLCKILCNHRK